MRILDADLVNSTCSSREMIKTKACLAVNFKLVHIWESDFLSTRDKTDFVKSVLEN